MINATIDNRSLVKKIFPNSYVQYVSMGHRRDSFFIVWSDSAPENKRQLSDGKTAVLAWSNAKKVAYPQYIQHSFCGYMGDRYTYPDGSMAYYCAVCDHYF